MSRKRPPLPPIEMPTFLDGPRFIEFLTQRGIDRYELTESQQRRWHDWESGGRASIYDTAGDILTEYMISERCLPDWVWAAEQRKSGKRDGTTRRTKAQIEELREDGKLMLANGMTVKEIARELKVSETSVRSWKRKMAEEETTVEEETPPGYQGLKEQGKVWVRA